MKKKLKLVAGMAVAALCILAGLERKAAPENFGLLLPEEQVPLSEEQALLPEEQVSLAEKSPETIQPEGSSKAEVIGESVKTQAHDKQQPAKSEKLVVHICGAVYKPGVYYLDEGSILYQAVDAAGGFKEDAGEEYLNLADTLSDGEKIYIPTVYEAKEEGLSKEAAKEEMTELVNNTKININTASAEMLCSLPGIGSSKAESIISYREAYGSFDTPEDIMKVEGIKDGLFRKIKDKITV